MSGHRYHLPPIGRQTLDSKWKLNLSKSVISYSSILIVKIWLIYTLFRIVMQQYNTIQYNTIKDSKKATGYSKDRDIKINRKICT